MDKFDGFENSAQDDEMECSNSDSDNNCGHGSSQKRFTYDQKCYERNLPKWEPWNYCEEDEKCKRKSSGKKILISVIAVILAFVICAVAIIIFVNNSDNTIINNKAQTASVSIGAENSTAVLSLTDSTQPVAAGSTAAGYILTDVTGIVDEALPSVVSITSKTLVRKYGSRGFSSGRTDDYYFFFGSNGTQGENQESTDNSGSSEFDEVEKGIGSGTIIAQNSSELLILTSYHVVEDSSSISVSFINDTSVDGYIKSADEDRDIAIVAVLLDNIDKNTMSSIKIATISTEKAKVGEGVIVIGNALGYGISVTTGIVSAVDREITVDGKTMTVLQTDAAVNSGNSGGCMLNSSGQIIGINEAKVKVSYVEGMCYAIPVVSNLSLIQDLLNEQVTECAEGSTPDSNINLGIRGRDIDENIQKIYCDLPQGVFVSSVIPGSGADAAGIIYGDIVVGINDTVVSTMDEIHEALKGYESGDVVKVVLRRAVNGKYQSMTLEVTLIDRNS